MLSLYFGVAERPPHCLLLFSGGTDVVINHDGNMPVEVHIQGSDSGYKDAYRRTLAAIAKNPRACQKTTAASGCEHRNITRGDGITIYLPASRRRD